MTVLAEHGVIHGDLGRQMRRAVGFRNVLVHECVDVDDAVVLSRLDDVADLDAFVAATSGLASR